MKRRDEKGRRRSESGALARTGGRSREGGGYTAEYRRRLAAQVVEHGASAHQVSAVFGVAYTTVAEWVRKYREGGPAALAEKPRVPPPRTPAQETKRQAVTALRREHPEFGTRRIRDLLARFSALGVSETAVRAILHEEGLLDEAPPRTAREHGPRRFERAAPNQLWQSDIFTFLLRRHERLYLCCFMDDHSRFIVGWALAHHQRSELVLEALERGVGAFGNPRRGLAPARRRRCAIESVLQDRFDVAVRTRSGGKRTRTRGLEPSVAIALGEPQDAEARAVALLGVRSIRQDGFDQRARLHAYRGRPVD